MNSHPSRALHRFHSTTATGARAFVGIALAAFALTACDSLEDPVAAADLDADLRQAGNTLHGYLPPLLQVTPTPGGVQVCAAWQDARLADGGFATSFYSFDFEIREGLPGVGWTAVGSARGEADGTGACRNLTSAAVEAATAGREAGDAWLRVRGMARAGAGRTTSVHHTLPAHLVVEGEGDEEPAVSAPLGAGGGEIRLDAEGEGEGTEASLLVPPGALTEETTVGITPRDPEVPTDGSQVVPGTTVFLSPSGLTFATPVTLTLGFDPGLLPAGANPAALFIGRWNADGSLTPLPSTVNVATGTVAAQLTSFSLYSIVVGGDALFVVTTSDDSDDGACTAAHCSLREAIGAANALGEPSRIELGSGNLTLTAALPVIAGTVEIVGPGSELLVIDAAATEGARRPVFVVQGDGAVRIAGLTVTGGLGETTSARGGGIRVLESADLYLDDVHLTGNEAQSGGGLHAETAGNVYLENVRFTGNRALGTGQTQGGGMRVASDVGELVLRNVSFVGNSGSGIGGGFSIHTRADAIRSLEDVDVRENTVGTAGAGGYFVQEGPVLMNRVRFVDNVAGGNGGGLAVTSGVSMTVTNSTIAGNTAGGTGSLNGGGGIWMIQGELSFVNVTLSGNAATNGGAMTASGHVSLINSTVVGNTASASAETLGGGGIRASLSSFTSVTMTNVLMSGNTAAGAPENCKITRSIDRSPAPFVSGGGNLADDDSCTLGMDPALGDLANTPAGVDPTLADNGGATPTHALLVGSAAIDAANTAACPATDQRGFGRVGACDIGAFEFGGTPPAGGASIFRVTGSPLR